MKGKRSTWPWPALLGHRMVILAAILTRVSQVASCPLQCQCNSQYYVYCQNVGMTDDAIGESLSRVSPSAKLLDLSANQISRISPHLFTKLPNLRFLNIATNNINQLASNVFQNLTRLRELRLNQNEVRSLDETYFSGMVNLKDLHLAENSLSSLPVGVFSELSSLEKLRLQKNSLQSLEAKTFSGLKKLKYLYLSSNSLKAVGHSTFSGLHTLQDLHLDHNQLSRFDDDAFKGLTNLLELNLSNNDISDMNFVYANDFYQTISSIDLSHNSISNIPDTVIPCNLNLDKVNLAHNRIHRIANHAFKSLSLETVNLSHNDLQEVDRQMFKDTKKILYLDLSANKIGDIKTGAFDSFRETILGLNLRFNNMSLIHTGMFRGMTRLRNLNLSFNKISSLDSGSFRDMTSLEQLDLSDNKLHMISQTSVMGPAALKYFDLTNNPIREMVGFLMDESGVQILLEVNSSVDSLTQTSARISWPYKDGSQLYWSVTVLCLNPSCVVPPYSNSLQSFTKRLTLSGLQAGTDYFVCVNPVFLSPETRVTQCALVHTEQPLSDGMTTGEGTELKENNNGNSYYRLCPFNYGLLVALLFLLSFCVRRIIVISP